MILLCFLFSSLSASSAFAACVTLLSCLLPDHWKRRFADFRLSLIFLYPLTFCCCWDFEKLGVLNGGGVG
jgi:hypothetical protein